MRVTINTAWLYRLSLVLVLSMAAMSTFSANAIPDAKLRLLLKNAIDSKPGFEDRFDAEVWLLDMSNRLEQFINDPESRLKLLKNVHYEAKRVNLPPELVLALIEVESHFDKFAISENITPGRSGRSNKITMNAEYTGPIHSHLFNWLFARSIIINPMMLKWPPISFIRTASTVASKYCWTIAHYVLA